MPTCILVSCREQFVRCSFCFVQSKGSCRRVGSSQRLTFPEYLKNLSPDLVFGHLPVKGCGRRKIISSALVEEIVADVAAPERLRGRLNKLAPDAQAACALAYLFGGSGIPGVGLEEHHDGLLASFLVYPGRDSDGSIYYFGFRDLEKQFCAELAAVIGHRAYLPSTAEPIQCLRSRACSDFAVTLTHSSNGLLKKRRDGGLTQAAVRGLQRLMHRHEVPTDSRDVAKKQATARVAFLMEYGKAHGYITEQERQYSTSPQQANKWLSLSPAQRQDELLGYAFSYLGSLSRPILRELLLAEDVWLSTSGLPVAGRKKLEHAFRILHYVGYVDLSTGGDGALWRASGAASRFEDAKNGKPLIILSDFSAIIPQEVPADTLYAFSLVGGISSFDQVYHGRIECRTVGESLYRGIRGEDILARLAEWRAPDNVVATVKEWVREFSRVCMCRSSMVLSFDEKSSRQLSAYRPFRDIVETLEVDRVFVVRHGREDRAWDILKSMGFDPRVPEMDAGGQPHGDEDMVPGPEPDGITAVFDFAPGEDARAPMVRTGKYSPELKELDISEVYHVIDYAMLMGHRLTFEYEGSPYIAQGVYTVIPSGIVRGQDPFIEAKAKTSATTRKYFVKRIKRIGVDSS